MKKQILEYYEWDDIQKFLCEELNITSDKFRKYNEVVGGEYKDFWHVWLSFNEVCNDTYQRCYLSDMEQDFDYLIEEYGDWVLPLKSALNELCIKHTNDLGYLHIHYC